MSRFDLDYRAGRSGGLLYRRQRCGARLLGVGHRLPFGYPTLQIDRLKRAEQATTERKYLILTGIRRRVVPNVFGVCK